MTNCPDARYLSQVRKFLFCPHTGKKRLVEKGRAFLEKFRQEDPEAGYDDIIANFGPPADFANTLMADLYPGGTQEVQERYIKRQKFWLGLAVCIGVVVAAILIGYIIWVANHDIAYVTTRLISGG